MAAPTPAPLLFSPLTIRGVTFRNRVGMAPMCTYQAVDGIAGLSHLLHYGPRGNANLGMIVVEATAVAPEARISPGCLGIWSDKHVEAFKPITAAISAHGTVPGIQIAHAGRKGATKTPWNGRGIACPTQEGGWDLLFAPSAIPWDEKSRVPKEMSKDDIDRVVQQFAQAAERAVKAGFKFIELHAAHGYLIHEFLSPMTNKRNDEYGGSFENRARLAVQVVTAIRKVIPADMPLFVRISATDWMPGEESWDEKQSVKLSALLKPLGVDLMHVSTGGNAKEAKYTPYTAYQVVFAEQIRKEANIATAAVGCITTYELSAEVVENGKADVVMLGRELLRNPYWACLAAKKAAATQNWPQSYGYLSL